MKWMNFSISLWTFFRTEKKGEIFTPDKVANVWILSCLHCLAQNSFFFGLMKGKMWFCVALMSEIKIANDDHKNAAHSPVKLHFHPIAYRIRYENVHSISAALNGWNLIAMEIRRKTESFALTVVMCMCPIHTLCTFLSAKGLEFLVKIRKN